MFLLWHLHFLLVDNSCDNVCGEFLIFFPKIMSKDLDGILKNLWWVLENLLKIQTYGNTLALFISSWSSFVAASIQERAIRFWRNLDELYQNWLYTFDALLMHFWCTFNTFWCAFDVLLKSAWKVHQKCTKSASKMHQKCIGILQKNVWKVTISDQNFKKRTCRQFQVKFTGSNLR